MPFCHSSLRPWHMRDYNALEESNARYLVANGVQFATIHITETGYKKSILDATLHVRWNLHAAGIHNYDMQPQGEENKVVVPAFFLSESQNLKTQASLYRPCTKNGDPRIWFYRMKESAFAFADDIISLIPYNGAIYVVNITRSSIEACCSSYPSNPIMEFIQGYVGAMSSISRELLSLIQARLARWMPVEIVADTGVGRTVESVLGIQMNSSGGPDYKGIEIKTKREGTPRTTLFSLTPDWDISQLKRSSEIVAQYGYGDIAPTLRTLQVTVSAIQPNSQGLVLAVNLGEGILELNYAEPGVHVVPIAAWRLERLHAKLLEKHHETFWLDIETMREGPLEYFRCKSVTHTKNPIISQMDVLLAQGGITVDLLLCRPSGHGDSYLFKVTPRSRELLFPDAIVYPIA